VTLGHVFVPAFLDLKLEIKKTSESSLTYSAIKF
jgi:hypothetical protein